MKKNEKMFEKTMFESKGKLIKWVNENYDLDINSVEETDLGSANCFYLKGKTGLYFMKEFQSKINREQLQTEVEVCVFLNQKGIHTSKFIKNLQGQYISEYKEKCINIQEFIDGKMYGMYELPEELLYLSGRYLGKINKYMSELDNYELSFHDEWLSSWSNEKEIEKLKKLLNERNHDCNATLIQKITKDFENKIEILSKMEGYAQKFLGSYKCNSHGDYSLLQLLCDGNEISAVVDFASVCCLPPTWEIICSYTYAASECKERNCINYAKFKQYLDEYLKENEIPRKDIILMPSLYFFNLIRSTFGYKQFLKDNSKANLEFAFWRTNICKWLYEHLQEFESFLEENY